MSYSVDDTQPVVPFEGEPLNLQPTIEPGDVPPPRSGGCLLSGLIAGMLIFVAVAIVALSAAAGWTAGQREANGNATATQNAAIDEQMQHIPADIASSNLPMLDTRLRWLATQAPDIPGVSDFMATATALYQSSLPTATPLASPTPEASIESAATEDFEITPEASGGYDLAAILNQAEDAIASSQWNDAIRLLDVIMGADSSFETATVRHLMFQSLTSYANQLYNAKKPAEANLLVDRAEEYGSIPGDLSYERYAAELYLEARAAVGTGSPSAINALQELINLGQGRYYQDAQTLLYNAYVARGDGYVAQGNNCSAAGQYQNAMNIFASGVANGKYAGAQNACLNATPTTDPNLVIPSDGQVAPVGVVATPGS